MEHNHYSSNVINTTTASYPSHSAISPHHLQNGQNQTLPPLQPHNPAMSMYASHPHTPRTPATPNTPASMGGYAPPPPQPSGRGSYPMMHNPYQHQQSYATSSAMMPRPPCLHPTLNLLRRRLLQAAASHLSCDRCRLAVSCHRAAWPLPTRKAL